MKKLKFSIYITTAVLSLFVSHVGIAQTASSQSVNKAAQNQSTKKVFIHEDSKSDQTFEGDLRFVLLGRRYDDEIVNSRVGAVFIEVDLKAHYQNWLTGRLNMLQLSASGSQSAFYGVSEGSVPNALFLAEASLAVRPIEGVEAKAGVLEITANSISSQIYPQNNAGLSLDAKLKSQQGASIGLIASQSIANSNKSNRVLDEDTTPLITIGTLQTSLPVESWGTTFQASASRFFFTDLSNSDADSAVKTGSTTTGNGAGGSLFVYEYRGNEYAASISQKIGLKNEATIKGSTIKNELAPEKSNLGWQGKFEWKTTLNNLEILPSYSRFYLESDAIPSPYANFLFGYANREGSVYNLRFNFLKQKFSLFGGFINSNVINTNATSSQFQADRFIYTLGAEAKYELF
jgi:hypothetical protein